MRVRLSEIELIKRLLPLLDAQTMLVGIIEEKQGSQHSALSDTLCSSEMHITIYRYLCIRNIGAINKYDLIQVLHLRLLFESC